MYTSLIHRIVIIIGFLSAIICFIWNVMNEREMLYSAFMAFCVSLSISLIFLFAIKTIANILFKYLNEQRKERLKEEEQENAKQNIIQ